MATANTGIITKTTSAVAAKKAAGKPVTLKDYVSDSLPELAKALPSVITPERFARMVTSTISRNPQLAQTTPASFMAAMFTAAQLGVEPNTPLGQAYLIPFRNHGTLECQFQLGFKGLIDLAHRSGEIASIQAHEVYENDEFDFAYGTDAFLKHKPAKTDRGKVIAYYGLFKTKDGANGFEFMSREDAEKHGKQYSKTYNNGPWKTNFDEMAKKTVLKKALKYAPLKSDFIRQVNADETVRTVIPTDTADSIFDAPADTIIDANGEVLNYDEEKGYYAPAVEVSEEGTANE